MAYRMAPVLVTLNDREGQSAVAGLFKCNPSNICAVFYQISTNSATRGPSATAGLLVNIRRVRCHKDIELKASENTVFSFIVHNAMLDTVSMLGCLSRGNGHYSRALAISNLRRVSIYRNVTWP